MILGDEEHGMAIPPKDTFNDMFNIAFSGKDDK